MASEIGAPGGKRPESRISGRQVDRELRDELFKGVHEAIRAMHEKALEALEDGYLFAPAIGTPPQPSGRCNPTVDAIRAARDGRRRR